MTELTLARLKEVLAYDASTGIFRWTLKRGRQSPGTVGGTLTAGRIQIRIDGKIYRAHRLAWFYVTGTWPNGEIDHKNGDASQNAFSNLRPCNRAFNMQNQRHSHRDSATGKLGVSVLRGRFRARIKHEGKEVALGMFDDIEAAHAAYVAAKRQFHEGNTL